MDGLPGSAPAQAGVAVVMFVTTNVDDLLLLAALFAHPAMRAAALVAGQFLGIGVLTVASVAAALLALAVPEGWVGLLGLAPLALGIRRLVGLRGRGRATAAAEASTSAAGRRAASQTLAVAAVIVASGGDNLAVYVPVFARDAVWRPVYVLVFALMTGLWCVLARWLVEHPRLGAVIRRHGENILPLILIALGLYVLADARALLP